MNQSPVPDVTMESDQNNNNENSSNNNLSMEKSEKYSLRQRGQRKSISNRLKSSAALNSAANINNSNADNDEPKNSKSKLKDKVTKEKPKQRAAPLSKYRRKTANARERTRMREINYAFETLRHAVPVVISGAQSENVNEKLTKITTLRMAMKYIKILNDIIENKTEASEGLLSALNSDESEKSNEMFSSSLPSPSPSMVSTSSSSSSYLTFSSVVNNKNSKGKEKLKSSGNVLAQNHHDYCKDIIRESNVKPTAKLAKVTTSTKKSAKASANKVAKKSSSKTTNVKSVKTPRNSNKNQKHQQPLAPPSKRQIQRTNSRIQNKLVNHLLGASNFNHTMLHSTPLNSINGINIGTSNIGMNNNLLHCLSKYDLSPCLTPPNDDSPADLGLILESDGESLQLSEPCFSPLELGLLLESDGESLHLSEPCLSPLNHLDALNSFNDLLHGSFSEPNSLDLYLS